MTGFRWRGREAPAHSCPLLTPYTARARNGRPTAQTPWVRVVGVVGPVRSTGLSVEPQPELFLPFTQSAGSGGLTLLARGEAGPASWLPWLASQIRDLDPAVPAPRVRYMRDLVSESTGRPRLYTRVLTAFALLGVILALIGIYGVTSFLTTSRTGEIAIRLCLGASPWSLMTLIVGRTTAAVLVGTIAGIGMALVVGRLMSGLFFGVGPHDWVVLGSSAAVLAAVGIGASYVSSARVVSACQTRTVEQLSVTSHRVMGSQ